jgi:hypothetical protein
MYFWAHGPPRLALVTAPSPIPSRLSPHPSSIAGPWQPPSPYCEVRKRPFVPRSRVFGFRLLVQLTLIQCMQSSLTPRVEECHATIPNIRMLYHDRDTSGRKLRTARPTPSDNRSNHSHSIPSLGNHHSRQLRCTTISGIPIDLAYTPGRRRR